MLKTNEGMGDRLLRIAAGLALLALYFFTAWGGAWHWALLIGIVPLLTGIVGYCPIYAVLGLSTCPARS